MIGSEQHDSAQPQRRGPRSRIAACVAAATLAFGVSLVAVALGSSTLTINAISSSKLHRQIIVSPKGRTLYALSPETASHLLCKSSNCLKFWPPLTVSSSSTTLKAGPGVHGKLGILHRSNGMLQVTFRGLPVYTFLKDHAKGDVNGEGEKSFGGTWHAVGAGATTPSTTTPTSTTPAAAPPSGGYAY